MTKRVLYLCSSARLGDQEKFILNINRAHNQKGQIQSKILFLSMSPAVEAAKRNGVETHVLTYHMNWFNPFALIKAVRSLRQFIKLHKIDIIHSMSGLAHLIAFWGKLGKPVQEIWYQYGPVGKISDRLGVCLPADVIIFNSQYSKDQHNRLPCIAPPKNGQFVIPPGLDPDNIPQAPEFQHKQEILILAGGPMTAPKSYETIFLALKCIQDSKPWLLKKLKLIVLGQIEREKDRTYQSFLRKLIPKLGLQKHIELKNKIEEWPELLKRADILVHSALKPEEYNAQVAEAMLSKVFVIGSDQGGLQEMLLHAETGLSYNTDHRLSAEFLATHIDWTATRLLSAKNLEIERMKKNARERVLKLYSVGEISSMTEKLYLSL